MEIPLDTTEIFALSLLYTKRFSDAREIFVLQAVKSEKLSVNFCAIVTNSLIRASFDQLFVDLVHHNKLLFAPKRSDKRIGSTVPRDPSQHRVGRQDLQLIADGFYVFLPRHGVKFARLVLPCQRRVLYDVQQMDLQDLNL